MQQLESTEETLPPTCGKSVSSASSSVVFSKMFRLVVLKLHGIKPLGIYSGELSQWIYPPKVLYGIIQYPLFKKFKSKSGLPCD